MMTRFNDSGRFHTPEPLGDPVGFMGDAEDKPVKLHRGLWLLAVVWALAWAGVSGYAVGRMHERIKTVGPAIVQPWKR